MRSTNFIDNSNKRAEYLEKISQFKPEKKKVCANHLTSLWLDPYERCVAGNRWNEDCRVLEEEGDDNNE